jgi:biopolymer transport protein ExbD
LNLQAHPKEEPEVNLTSLIDVVLLLLIFFMVTTSFVRETEIRMQLPEAQAEARLANQDSLEITVTADGNYLVDGREIVNRRPDTLRRALVRIAGESREQQIVIRADARVSHQSVVTAMDVAGRLGFVRINIATVEHGTAAD